MTFSVSLSFGMAIETAGPYAGGGVGVAVGAIATTEGSSDATTGGAGSVVGADTVYVGSSVGRDGVGGRVGGGSAAVGQGVAASVAVASVCARAEVSTRLGRVSRGTAGAC